jgi:Domain of Unknown Function (DUF1080)
LFSRRATLRGHMNTNLLSPRIVRIAAALVLATGAFFSAAAEEKKSDTLVLFDGKSLDGWKKSGFSTEGNVEVKNPFKDGKGAIVIDSTDALNGVTTTKNVPVMNYEASVEAMKINGSDFFCALTFPVEKTALTFLCGGWGGGVVGISSVDDADASENETTKTMAFKNDKWYRVRVRVTPGKVEAWIDDEKFVDLKTEGRKLSLRHGEIDESLPFGIATYQTSAAIRDVRIVKIAPEKK